MNPFHFAIYLLILSNFLLFQSPRSVQSISLSRLCGQFGHQCFGANWGKRALLKKSLPDYLSSNLNTNNDKMSISEELRLKLFRQRLRQLFGLE